MIQIYVERNARHFFFVLWNKFDFENTIKLTLSVDEMIECRKADMSH